MVEFKRDTNLSMSEVEIPQRYTKDGLKDAELNNDIIVKEGLLYNPRKYKILQDIQRFYGKSGMEAIDLNLVDCTGKYFEFEYLCENSLIKSAFNDNAGDHPLASFIIKSDDDMNEKWINYKPYDCSDVDGTVNNNTIKYTDVYTDTDIEYKNLVNNIKQYITLNSASAPTTFDFTIKTCAGIELKVGTLPILTIQYTGTSEAGTIEVTSGNHLIGRTQATTAFDLDLTNASYDTLAEVVAYIDALGTWSASTVAGSGSCRSKTLETLEETDCKTAAKTLDAALKDIIAVNPDMPNSRTYWQIKRPFAISDRTGSENSLGFIELIPAAEHANGVYDVIRITTDATWVSNEFTAGATEITIDPTTYRIIRDYGNITFCGDYASGNQHGTNGFMNGYGYINRGTEAVQTGGTRCDKDNNVSNLTFVDRDGTETTGAAATCGEWTYSSPYWYTNLTEAKIKYTSPASTTEVWTRLRISSTQGIIKTTVNGVVNYIDLYNSSSGDDQKILLATGLTSGEQNIEIEVIETLNISGSVGNISFYGFETYTSGNELANKGAITINSRSTYGLDCTFAKHPKAIRYDARGNLANDTGGDPAKGSFSCWVKPNFDYDADTNPHYILDTKDNSTGVAGDYILYYEGSDDKFRLAIYNGANWTTCMVESTAQTFSAGDVLHILITYDETSGCNLYVNNVKTSDTSTWTAVNLSFNMLIGNEYTPESGQQLNMIIAEPTLFDYVLTDEEVYDIYTSTKPIWEMDFGRRVEVLNRTNKGMLFNYSGVIGADHRIGSFTGLCYTTSAPSGTFITESQVTFVGDWSDAGNYRYTLDSNAYAIASFTGTEIWYCFYTGINHGIVECILDEGTSKEKHVLIDQHTTIGSHDRYALIATGLENTSHTLKIKSKVLKAITSTGFYIIMGVSGSADRMFLYTSSGSENISSDSLTVNNRLIDNVLDCNYTDMPNAIQFPDKGNISEYDHEGTIECTVKTSWAGNDNSHHEIIDTRNSTGYYGLHIRKNNTNTLLFEIGTTSSILISADVSSIWYADTVHHIITKWWRPTSSTMGLAIYFDGIKIAENKSQSFTPVNHTTIIIGNYAVINSSYDFEGNIYDLSVHNHAFNDGGVSIGSMVDPLSEVGKSYRNYSKKYKENVSDQIGDGSTTIFKLSRGLLEREYPNDSGWIWAKNKKIIDSSNYTQIAYGIIYDSINDIYYAVGANDNGSSIDAVLWYSSNNDLETCTWTRKNIYASSRDEYAFNIIYDSTNEIYYAVGYYNDITSSDDAVVWYSSSNDLTTATWTMKDVDNSSSFQYARDIIYDSTNEIYYAVGYHYNGSDNDAVVWYSSSNDLTTATWTRVNIDASVNGQIAYGIIYDSINEIYYAVGQHYNGSNNDAVVWYSSSNDLTTATWTRVNIDALTNNKAATRIIYDSTNEIYYAVGYHYNGSDNDAVVWYSSSNDLTTATWTRVNIDTRNANQQLFSILYNSSTSTYYAVGFNYDASNNAVLYPIRIAGSLSTTIINNIIAIDDGTIATVSSAKLGTYCRANGAITATDTTITVDSWTNDETEIDTNGGYLWIGQANSLWRKKIEYSAYDAGTNSFTIANSGTIGEDFADNTIIEVCGTVTLSATPAEGSIVEITYYYSGDSVDREYGLVPDRLNKNLWLDVTGTATTGWQLAADTAKSGMQKIYSNAKGQVSLLSIDKIDSNISLEKDTNCGIIQLISNQGTKKEKSILLDNYNSSSVNQILKSIVDGLSNQSIIRLVNGVDKNASSSDYYSEIGANILSSQYDLTKDALASNDVNCVFDYSAIRVVNGQLDYDRDKSGNLQLAEALDDSETEIDIDTDTAADLDRLGRPNGIIKVDSEFIKYEDIDFTSSTTATLLNCKRGYLAELTGGTATTHDTDTDIQLVGAWRNNVVAMNSSWYSSDGVFPYRALLIGCGTEGQVDGGLVIWDLDENKNYKVCEANDSNAIRGAVKCVKGHTGKIEVGYGTLVKGLTDLDWINNEILGHGTAAGYGSAAATKGTISQVNEGLGWSYTTHVGVTLNSSYINDIAINFDSINYDVWVTTGKSGTTGTSAGINRIYDGGDGILDIEYDLDSDTSYWATKLAYDIANDDLYVSQTNGTADQEKLSKIGTPKISADSTIDTADGTDRLITEPMCNGITIEGSNVWFATDSGAKKVVKASFSSGATDTLNSSDFSELSIDVCEAISYDPDNEKLLLGFQNGSDGLLIECDTDGANPTYYDKSSETDEDRENVLSSDIMRDVCCILQDYREIENHYTQQAANGWALATDSGITIKEPEGEELTYSTHVDVQVTKDVNDVYTLEVIGVGERRETLIAKDVNDVYTRTLDEDPNVAPMVDKIITKDENDVYTSSDPA